MLGRLQRKKGKYVMIIVREKLAISAGVLLTRDSGHLEGNLFGGKGVRLDRAKVIVCWTDQRELGIALLWMGKLE
jgi:hypothetical protein